jgi:predicted unusual protein kinase regulating ubiquinone biosynthesis (AarF/ABC1/UbiB family)
MHEVHEVDVVGSAPVFKGLGELDLERVAQVCEKRQFEAGDLMVEEGSRGDGFFVIDAGEAEVVKATRGGRQHAIARLRPGDHFGEMSLIADHPTSASVRAAGPVRCLFIARERFLCLIDEHPSIGKQVLWWVARTMARRLVDADRRYARALDVRERGSAVRHLASLFWMQTVIVWSYAWVWLRRTLRLGHSPEALAHIHRQNALRFKRVACQLKGANVKLGQLASLQGHLLPAEVIDELRSMRDGVSATEYPLIAGMIAHEFGVGPLEVFAEFDKAPIAVASMGQVHLARLPSGEQVVVKVLHPGLERSVEIDLWLMRRLMGVVSRFVKKVDLMELYRQSEEPLRKELDLLHEGHATEEIGAELAAIGVKVPRVYWRYSTRRVLTLEFIEGCKLDDLTQMKAWGVDRKKLMHSYLAAFLRQALEGGYFHCDPHPANAFCTPAGELVLLDFGMVKRLPEAVRGGLLKEVLGSFFNNPKLYADGIIERGVVAESERGTLERFAGDVFSDPHMRSAIFDHDVKRDGDMKQLSGKMGELLGRLETFRTPQDQLMFLRALGIVIDVCREVYPEESTSQLVMPVAMPIFGRFMQEHPEYASLVFGAGAPAEATRRGPAAHGAVPAA